MWKESDTIVVCQKLLIFLWQTQNLTEIKNCHKYDVHVHVPLSICSPKCHSCVNEGGVKIINQIPLMCLLEMCIFSYKKQELNSHEFIPVLWWGLCCSSLQLSVLFFVLFVFVLCLIVCPMFPVSLDCPFLIVLRFSLTFISKLNCKKK